MEMSATDFTKRLVESRIKYYTNSNISDFFETDNNLGPEDYYSLFFKVSMNVPRILGYILSFCYQSKIVYNKKINKTDIEAASQRYYERKDLNFL